MLDTVS